MHQVKLCCCRLFCGLEAPVFAASSDSRLGVLSAEALVYILPLVSSQVDKGGWRGWGNPPWPDLAPARLPPFQKIPPLECPLPPFFILAKIFHIDPMYIYLP